MSDSEKRKVLFLCTGNSARSILGEYLLRAMDPRFTTWSAGAEPTGRVHPMALKVLRDAYGIDAAGARSKSWEAVADVDFDVLREEYGIDASNATSKSWEAVADVDFDVVITVCDHARDTCPLVPSGPAVQAHWGSPDPAAARGSEAEVEAAFRRVAAEIHGRLERFCALPFETGGRDELARRIRALGE